MTHCKTTLHKFGINLAASITTLCALTTAPAVLTSCEPDYTDTADTSADDKPRYYEEWLRIPTPEKLPDYVHIHPGQTNRALNAIRFDNITYAELNQYFIAIRKFIDEVSSENIDPDADENAVIAARKVCGRGKFAVIDYEPFMGGGLLVTFVFPSDDLYRLYTSWVYSFVDEDEEIVTGYEVRYFHSSGDIRDHVDLGQTNYLYLLAMTRKW